MHRRFIGVAVAAMAGVLALGLAPASATPPPPPSNYYLALGDSLAAGYQPDSGVDLTGGYVGHVWAKERTVKGPTNLVNIACPGETTDSMINGGVCSGYTSGNQLDDAVAFLNAHSGHVGLITIDVGANDVDKCIDASGTIDFACVQAGITALNQNLPTIYDALRAAAPDTQVIVANYYDPFLAIWLQRTHDARSTAHASVSLAGSINNTIAQKAAAESPAFDVADVFTAFKTPQWNPRVDSPFGTIPTNVYKICIWTHMCTHNPPDIHATDAGYSVIGTTVLNKITP